MRFGGRIQHDLGATERPRGDIRVSVLPDTTAGGMEDSIFNLLRPEVRAAVIERHRQACRIPIDKT